MPCNSADGQDTTDPTTPTGVRAVAGEGSYVDLNWIQADDNVGVVGYRVERDGVQVASVGSLSGYRDNGVAAGETHRYVVRAVDAAGTCRRPRRRPRSPSPRVIRRCCSATASRAAGWGSGASARA